MRAGKRNIKERFYERHSKQSDDIFTNESSGLMNFIYLSQLTAKQNEEINKDLWEIFSQSLKLSKQR